MYEHLNPTQEIKVGEMVRWDEYPDRLYYVLEMNITHCGHSDYCKIESIDHKYRALVRIADLTWDDVDFIEQ